MPDPSMICEDPDEASKLSKLTIHSITTVLVVEDMKKIIAKWKISKTPSQILAFFTLDMKGLNLYGKGQNRIMTSFLDALRSQPSWSVREESKLES
ncbi:hypothetical protein M9H77_34596 [Catharanthus roseus]|uniref:Uncharacterized protein n=1 Tax=Catharanthus roseus TaxID=4058 RepID=A0ACB9ZLN0_CATRO|nr:hypothetical protein M9H77_34596 [Catharanthus roseus]